MPGACATYLENLEAVCVALRNKIRNVGDGQRHANKGDYTASARQVCVSLCTKT